jgi:hypothetical protein
MIGLNERESLFCFPLEALPLGRQLLREISVLELLYPDSRGRDPSPPSEDRDFLPVRACRHISSVLQSADGNTSRRQDLTGVLCEPSPLG